MLIAHTIYTKWNFMVIFIKNLYTVIIIITYLEYLLLSKTMNEFRTWHSCLYVVALPKIEINGGIAINFTTWASVHC